MKKGNIGPEGNIQELWTAEGLKVVSRKYHFS